MTAMNSSVETLGDSDFPIVVLHDEAGREARVAPAAGFNAFSFSVPHEGQSVRVFVEPPSDDVLRGGGFSFGCPILFPFPNRTRDGRYVFAGREHQLDINWKDGNAIHGLVATRPWRVLDADANREQGSRITARFVTARFVTDEHPEVMRQYPFPCALTATWTLRDGALHLHTEVENTGDAALPMGFGIHPWFPAPLTPRGKRADCVLTVPARGRWELESEEQLIPTGRVLPLEENYDFSRGAKLGKRFLDDVYTDLIYENDQHICALNDGASGLRLEIRASRNFREHVVYAPLDRDIICLEPYTSTTDFVNLSNRGVDAGMVVLKPGSRWQGDISIALRPAALRPAVGKE